MTLNVQAELLAGTREYLLHLVAHEFFHTWAMSGAPLPGELRWLNEGVTDYFAYTTLLNTELCTVKEWHTTLAGKLTEFERNKLRSSTSLESAGGPAFFSDEASYQLTYSGGLVIGAWIDAALQQAGTSDLVDLMRLFLNDERWDDRDAQPRPTDFFVALEQLGGKQLAARTRELVSKPLNVDLVELFAEVGVKLEREWTRPETSPRANFEGTSVAAIDPNGQGHELGLRSGDRLVEVNGNTVSTPEEIYRAWGAPVGRILRVRFERAGKQMRLELPVRVKTRLRVLRDHFG